MKSTGWSFIEHEKRILVEGFNLHKFINRCLAKKIDIKDMVILSDYEMEMTVKNHEIKEIHKCAKKDYRITEKREGGYLALLEKIKHKKALLAGFLVFSILIYIQSLFIHEIRIYGYESIPEEHIRRTLAERGFKEGALKLKTLEEVEALELYLFEELDSLVYAKIEYNGCLAIVTIAESKGDDKNGGSITSQELNTKEGSSSNIVSEIDGYVYEIIAEAGIRAAEDGAFVRAGDVLISGRIPLQSTAYGTDAENITEMSVRARGTAKLIVPERRIFYLEKYDIIKEPTGKKCYGIEIEFDIDTKEGEKHFTADTQNIAKAVGRKTNNHIGADYEACLYGERVIIEEKGKIPLTIKINKREEVELKQKKRDEKRLEELAQEKIRRYIKENLPKNCVISNLSLNFTEKENIIIVMAFLETIQNTGIEQEISFDEILDGQ